MSPRIPMKVRNVRVSDRDWNAAHARAERDGDNLSEKIREWLKEYAKGEK